MIAVTTKVIKDSAPRRRELGFTLLEIVISVAILAFISMFVARTIQRGMQAKTKIERDIDRTVALREALSFMAHDIQLAFHYRDVNVELYNAALAAGCKAGGTTPSPNPNPGPTPTPTPTPPPGPNPTPNPSTAPQLQGEICEKKKTQKIKTAFVGEAEKVDFATLSNIRTQKDEQTSDQAEVGYELKDCRTPSAKGTNSSKCLWRRFSPVIDDKPLEGGKSFVLLEHVKSLSLRYLGPGENVEWVKSWHSETTAGSAINDAKNADNFPLAVEITLEIEDQNVTPPKEVGMTIVAQVRFPNNPEPVDPNAPPGDATDQGQGQGQGGTQ